MSWGECGVLMTCASFMLCAVSGDISNVVDIFNVTAGTWSTAALSQARSYLAATSLPNARVAIFAGGQITGTCCCVCLSCCRMGLGVRGMHEWGGVWCVDDVCKSHALCSSK
jgi:hypothetical protein